MASEGHNPAWAEWKQQVISRSVDLAVPIIQQGARKWHKTGRNRYKCCSPLRPDTGPGFEVYGENGTWVDWSTKEGGDLAKFIQLRDGCDFVTALNAIAKEAGLPSWEEARGPGGGPQATPEELIALWKGEDERRKVRDTLSAIVHLCHAMLPSQIRDYLKSHYGFSDETIDLEKIGWVPDGLSLICREQLQHVTKKDLLLTGMFFDRKSKDYDIPAFMSQRILFPYWKDGFPGYAIGRSFGTMPIDASDNEKDEDGPEAQEHKRKYKKLLTHSENYPYVSPTIVNELWGEDCVRFATKVKSLLIIEGITDALLAKQVGFDSILSPITTNPPHHLRDRLYTLARKWKEVVILNDNEVGQAGAKGALRYARDCWDLGIACRIGTLPMPEGATKIDVNAFLVAKITDGLKVSGATPESAEAYAKSELQKVIDSAVTLPEFLVGELTPDLKDLEARLVELGTLGRKLSKVDRAQLLTKIIAKLKKASKDERSAYRATFLSAAEGKEKEKAPVPTAISAVPPGTITLPDGWDDPADGAMVPVAAAPKLPATPTALRILANDGFYERETSDSRERISTFTLRLEKMVLQEKGPEVLICRVVGPGGTTICSEWRISHEAWTGRRAFLSGFQSSLMSWYGTDDEVQAIKEMLTRDGFDKVPKIQETSVLGFHEVNGKARFVLVAGTLDERGQWMDQPDLVFMSPIHSGMQSKLYNDQQVETCPSELAKRVWESLPKCHAPIVVQTMIAWFASCPFKPKLQKQLGSFPILNMFGTAGSGKTTLLRDVFWPTFSGVRERSLFPCDQSKYIFTEECSTSNAIPVPFDEYKPSEMGIKSVNELHRLIKGIYGGETRLRGHSDLHVRLFCVNAPLCVSGETKIENDLALTERCLFVPLDKNWIRKNPGSGLLCHQLMTEPLFKVATAFQSWSVTADIETMYKRAEKYELDLRTTLSYDARIRANIVCALFGLEAFEWFGKVLGAKLATISRETFVRAMVNETFEVREDGSIGRVLDAFDQFVVDASVMANTGHLQEDVHYAFFEGTEVGAGRLFLYVRGVENARSEWINKRGDHRTSPGHRALVRMAREKANQDDSYILELGRAHLGTDQFVNGVSVRYDKIIEMGADGFPYKTVRKWGGPRNNQPSRNNTTAHKSAASGTVVYVDDDSWRNK
jgi:hypothetical protein